jgi:hypothetical protein
MRFWLCGIDEMLTLERTWGPTENPPEGKLAEFN